MPLQIKLRKKNALIRFTFALILLNANCLCHAQLPVNKMNLQKVKPKQIIINAANGRQTMDGFGVNFTPAQWNNGKFKPVIDLLVKDLGATLIRFDCTGLADWLDPAKRNASGKYPEAYLQQIYSNTIFKNAWASFRYFNEKGITPSICISGRIPPALGKKDDTKRLADFDGYAEMIATLLKWAREKELLKFSLFSPFNETDLGFPEGAKVEPDDVKPALEAMVKKLKEYHLDDLKMIVMDDSGLNIDKISPVLSDTLLQSFIAVFGVHYYGQYGAESAAYSDEKDNLLGNFTNAVKGSIYNNTPCWITEYGDLDQSNEIEYEFATRITNRLVQVIYNGFSGAEVWDAFDNFHEHDTVWAEYGLIKTDTTNITRKYIPKKRYYASKQFYRFVPKGYKAVRIETPADTAFDVYSEYHRPLRNMQLIAFVSPDKKDFTISGTSAVENDISLEVLLKSFGVLPGGRKVTYYSTTETDNCKNNGTILINNGKIKAVIKKKSIFTLTTL